MNVQLLESVRKKIVLYPDRFCAAQWAFARNATRVLREGAVPDGFRACIAGHVLLENGSHDERDLLEEGGFHTGGTLWKKAARALQIGADPCRELFFPSQWDKPYKQEYYLCAEEEEAHIAAAYLDYFMRKHAGSAAAASPRDAFAPERPAGRSQPVARGERTPVPTP
jgi:hypothetical protein